MWFIFGTHIVKKLVDNKMALIDVMTFKYIYQGQNSIILCDI